MTKKKLFIAIIASVVAVIFIVFIVLQMVNKEERPTGDNILEVSVVDLGYGVDWIRNAAERYEELNEGVTVNVYPFEGDVDATLQSGPLVNTTDILMPEYSTHLRLVRETLDDGSPILADLTDAYDIVVEGETKSVKDRLYTAIEEAYNYCGTDKYYAFPVINDINGLYYNYGMFEDNGWSVPRTTDEMIQIATTISDSVYPFIWFPGYWNFCLPVWWAQYEGLDTYLDYFHPTQDVRPSDENSQYQKQKGNEYALEVLNQIVNPSLHSGFNYPGCVSAIFTDIQTDFLLGKAAMIPNGGWLENEMADEANGVDVRVMKLPVISKLGEKLGIGEDVLRLLIDYADGEITVVPEFTSSKGFSRQEVVDAVKRARSLNSCSVSYAYPALVPAYSDAIPLAKDFLAWLTSSEARKIIFETAGIMPCTTSENDLEEQRTYSKFKNSKIEIYGMEEYEIVPMVNMSDPFYFVPNFMTYSANPYPAKVFGAQSEKDRMSVSEFLEAEIAYLEKDWDYTWSYVNTHLEKPIGGSN